MNIWITSTLRMKTYEVEDAPNEVEVGMDDLSQVLFTNTKEDRESEIRPNTELVPISYEEVV